MDHPLRIAGRVIFCSAKNRQCGAARRVGFVLLVLPTVAAANLITVTARDHTASVFAGGMKLGELDVSSYTGDKTPSYGGISANISANFTPDTLPGSAKILASLAPFGLTYMQAHTFSFQSGKQQKIFRDTRGNELRGVIPDPPQRGYVIPGGHHAYFDDRTPWYSSLEPAGLPGAVPPLHGYAGSQYRDNPALPFTRIYGTDGLLDLLIGTDTDGRPIGLNGAWSLETVLVGVGDMPDDDGNPANGDELLTGIYKVTPLVSFRWGFDLQFVDDLVSGITAADYVVTMQPLLFSAPPTSAFWEAFDGAGDNAAVEWKVLSASSTSPEPNTVLEPSTLSLLGAALLLLLLRGAATPRRAAVEA